MIKTTAMRNATLTKVTVHATITVTLTPLWMTPMVVIKVFVKGETAVESDDTSVNVDTTVVCVVEVLLEGERVVDEIVVDGERVVDEIVVDGERVVDEIVVDGERVVDEIVVDGERVVDEIVVDGERVVDEIVVDGERVVDEIVVDGERVVDEIVVDGERVVVLSTRHLTTNRAVRMSEIVKEILSINSKLFSASMTKTLTSL